MEDANMIYVEVVQRDFARDFSKRGMELESKVIEDYIASERTFNFTYFDKDMDIDVFLLEQNSLFSLLQDLKEMELRHEELSLEKEHKSRTLAELERTRSFFQKIARDPYFHWEYFTVSVKVEVDIEVLNI